jgi:nitrite reductase/ring-hydroxylating ferredoxin subunit
MSNFVSVAKVSDFDNQQAQCVEVEGKSIALFKLGKEFFASDDTCTHEGGPLSDGNIDGDEIECPWHGACFNIRSGKVTLDPADEDVSIYAVRLSGDMIEVDVE